jgi:hypothetical protein
MKKLAFALVIVVLLGFGAIYLVARFAQLPAGRGDGGRPNPAEPVFCTMDAKVCPDGSAVGRDPANGCEFFPCPDAADPNEPVACTADARICPDGSGVGRDGARGCTFQPCPGEGTVTGALTLVATCPYESVFDKPCPTSPYEGDVRLEPIGGGAVTMAAVAGGTFYATLPAGTYRISSGRVLPRCDAQFTVAEGEETIFAASCDAGVR